MVRPNSALYLTSWSYFPERTDASVTEKPDELLLTTSGATVQNHRHLTEAQIALQDFTRVENTVSKPLVAKPALFT